MALLGGGGTAAASPILTPGRAVPAGGGPAQPQGWQRGEAAGGARVHPHASQNNPQQLLAALHRDPTIWLQMPPPPTAVIQLPPPKTLLPEGRGAGWGHKQGLTSAMLPQHPTTAQAGGLVEGWQGAARAHHPARAGGQEGDPQPHWEGR